MKKTILLTFIFGACIFSIAGDQVAAFKNGNDIYSMLLEDSTFSRAYGDGYVIGVHDAFNGEYFSSPKGVTQIQIIDIVKKYFEENPEQRHYGAAQTIVVALHNAFPKKETPTFSK